jgi:dihydroneopterin aldolase
MTATSAKIVQPQSFADARAALAHVFIRDLVLECSIGVHAHERGARQRVRINLDLGVQERPGFDDHLADVVCYEEIAAKVRAIVGAGHVNLVETLAERIAEACFEDLRVRMARVRIEKLDVFADAASVGVEIERFNPKV